MSTPSIPIITPRADAYAPNTMQFYWSPPAYVGSSAIQSYILSSLTTPNNVFTSTFILDSNTNTYTVTNLQNGFPYTFQITASNLDGPGVPTNFTTMIPGALPGTSADFGFVVNEDFTITYNFTKPYNNGDAPPFRYLLTIYETNEQGVPLNPDPAQNFQKQFYPTVKTYTYACPNSNGFYRASLQIVNDPGYSASLNYPFTPLWYENKTSTSVNSLLTWFDATDFTFMSTFSSNGSTFITNITNSAFENTILSTAGATPTYSSTFNGAQMGVNSLFTGAKMPEGNQPFSFFNVSKPEFNTPISYYKTNTSGTNVTTFGQSNDNPNNFINRNTTANGVQLNAISYLSNTDIVGQNITPTYCFEATYSPSNYTMYLNGIPVFKDAVSTLSTYVDVNSLQEINYSIYPNIFNEMLVYTSNLSDTDRTEREGYLMNKHNIVPGIYTQPLYWFDASSANYMNFDGNTNSVIRCIDRSVVKNSSGETNTAIYYSSESNSFVFSSTLSSKIPLPGYIPNGDVERTFFFVATPPASNTNAPLAAFGNATFPSLSNYFVIVLQDQNLRLLTYNGSSSNSYTTTATFTPNVPNIFAVSYYQIRSGSNYSNYYTLQINTSSITTVNNIAPETLGGFNRLGEFRNPSSTYFDGQIHEFLAFRPNLSPHEMMNVTEYLAKKWSIPYNTSNYLLSNYSFAGVGGPSPFLWFDANDISGNVTGQGPANGHLIQAWVNKIDSSNVLQPIVNFSTPAGYVESLSNYPIYQASNAPNGLPAVRFTGFNWCGLIAPTTINTPYWAFFIVYSAVENSYGNIMTFRNPDQPEYSQATDCVIDYGLVDGFPRQSYQQSFNTQQSVRTFRNAPHLITAYTLVDNSNRALRIDGYQQSNIAPVGTLQGLPIQTNYFGLGANTGITNSVQNYPFNGYIHEFVAFSTVVSENYVRSIEQSLLTKWKIATPASTIVGSNAVVGKNTTISAGGGKTFGGGGKSG